MAQAHGWHTESAFMLDQFPCPKCGRTLRRSGEFAVNGVEFPVFQCDECIVEAEMYGEPFVVPEPLEIVFISWFEGGEVFRSGLTYQRGTGRVFYFAPGHETHPIYHDSAVQSVLRNAVHWAYNPANAWKEVAAAPNVPAEKAREEIGARPVRSP